MALSPARLRFMRLSKKQSSPSSKGESVKLSLNSVALKPILGSIKKSHLQFLKSYPNLETFAPKRQPVHTVYGGAHLFSADTPTKMAEIAAKTLQIYAPNGVSLARALSEPENDLWIAVYSRVLAKLKKEAVEDFRIDFEDGYGNRPDAEEDQHALQCADEMAKGLKAGSLPPFIGIRIKPLTPETAERSLRTLDLFLTTFSQKTQGRFPSSFVVTLPKITQASQCAALAKALSVLEKKLKIKAGSIGCEIMVETAQAILDQNGSCPLPEFVEACEGRCTGAHFGTYDYTASLGITASHQSMSNPVCDFAKHMMQVSLSGKPVFLSDGATNIMPVGPHRLTSPLTPSQKLENEEVVHHAWSESYDHIRYSLETGFYQGWDLHPAQIPIRFAAVYSFFLESLGPTQRRLKTFIEKSAQATLSGDIFDDAATGQGLLNFFLRGIACGAITEEEALETGLTLEEIRGRSFLKILQNRRGIKPRT